MLKSLLAFLMMAPPALPPEVSQEMPSEKAPVVSSEASASLEKAKGLYKKGTVRYGTEDFVGAIEAFTDALDLVDSLGEGNNEIKLLLRYNIARARVSAYDIHQDIAHLRQARDLYRKFIQDADSAAMFDNFNPQDVDDARKELRAVELRLAALENQDKKRELPSVPVPSQVSKNDWKKPRNVGIGLTVSGGVALVGGAVMLASGSQFRAHAQEQVMQLNDLMVPMDHPAWIEGEQFIEQETRKGKTLMALGGTLASVGAVGTGVGIYFLVKSGKLKNGKIEPSVALSPTFAGVQLKGSF